MDNHHKQGNDERLRVLFVNRRTLISIILLISVVFLITSNEFWRWMYPIGYQSAIQKAAAMSDVDPLLVASVIHVESKYHTEDVSHAGAIGLMQLMPDTAQWIVTQIQSSGKSVDGESSANAKQNLAVPSVNIRLGSWYIRYLINRFHGNEVAAIAAYNGGPKRVQEWLSNGTWNGQLRTFNDIPVGETRHFVDRVFYNYDLYKRIYGHDVNWR